MVLQQDFDERPAAVLEITTIRSLNTSHFYGGGGGGGGGGAYLMYSTAWLTGAKWGECRLPGVNTLQSVWG